MLLSGNSNAESRLATANGVDQPVEAPPLTPKASLTAGMPRGDALIRMKELLQAAPPGQNEPDAWVSLDYPRNSKKLLVLVPSPDDPPGHWAKSHESSVETGVGLPTAPRLLRWAERNGYAACLFSAKAMQRDPHGAWTRVFIRNPSRSVYIMTAPGGIDLLVNCVKEEHPLSYSRVRSLASAQADEVEKAILTADTDMKTLLKRCAAPDFREEGQPAEAFCKGCFAHFQDIDAKWQENEANKLGALAGLKENDVPGLRRVPVDQRVNRINRDRANDELSRLCRAGEQFELDQVD